MSKIRPSAKASSFTESVIREMTRLSIAHGAINLSQGFPDFPAPTELKEAARRAIDDDINQYPITWGAEAFREAIAAHHRDRYGMTWVDAERHVTVTCGSTEAMIASMLGVLDPGDEVVVFEPFYENHRPTMSRLARAVQLKWATGSATTHGLLRVDSITREWLMQGVPPSSPARFW